MFEVIRIKHKRMALSQLHSGLVYQRQEMGLGISVRSHKRRGNPEQLPAFNGHYAELYSYYR